MDTPDDEAHALGELIAGAGPAGTVVLTGAGISTASGIPDFRSASGLWSTVNPMEIATGTVLRNDPARFWEWYGPRVQALSAVRPNPAHEAVADLEAAGLVRAVVTQNIDGLHQAAGSGEVIEVHGSVHRGSCMECGVAVDGCELRRAATSAPLPRCGDCGGVLRPGTVLFGEMLPVDAFDRASEVVADARLLLCAGSSLEVYPVAGLPELVFDAGRPVAICTQGATPYDREARFRSHAPLAELLPAAAAVAVEARTA